MHGQYEHEIGIPITECANALGNIRERTAVIFAAMRGDRDQSSRGKMMQGGVFVVAREINRLERVNNGIPGREHTIGIHTFVQQIATRARRRSKMPGRK